MEVTCIMGSYAHHSRMILRSSIVMTKIKLLNTEHTCNEINVSPSNNTLICAILIIADYRNNNTIRNSHLFES